MRRPLAAALAALALLTLVPAAPASAHPIAHAGPPRVRNLRPAFGDVVPAGPTTIAAQVVSDVAITGHRLTVDGQVLQSKVEGDATHPTISGVAQLAPGDHLVQLDVTGSDGRTGGRAWRVSAGGPAIRRIAGEDRITTAVAVSRDLFPAGGATGAVLARADGFADALAGAALAQKSNAPILLTSSSALSPATAAELQRALVPGSTVYLLGGTSALADQVDADVRALGFLTRRLSGASRAGTAAAVAAELLPSDTAIVVNGFAFADAVGASAASAARGAPILVTERDSVPDETKAALSSRNVRRVYVVGGEGAVSATTLSALAAAVGGDAQRIAGPDRYATAIAVAKTFFAPGRPVVLASGEAFPDALAGGRRAAALGGPLVLTAAARLVHGADVGALAPGEVVVLGGPAAVAADVEGDVRRAAYDTRAPGVDSVDPAPGSVISSMAAFTVDLGREVRTDSSNVYVTMGDEEVPGTLAAGDFADTLVFTPTEIPMRPASGVSIPVRVLVAAFDGAAWRHHEFRLTYRKLDLARGDTGEAVAALQRRLLDLGYWLPGIDGSFGTLTTQAVMAFQKAERLPRTGVVNDETRERLAVALRPQPREARGDHIEVDKARQVLLVVRGGRVAWTLNTSTGTERPYTHDGYSSVARTPVGAFRFSRQIDGYRESHLGTLYRPKYFTSDGVAVHGSASVPAHPASHGCVRLTNAAMDWVWANGIMPLGSRIVVY